METTGTAIMKKLSGDATAAVATGMKIAKAFEDMNKPTENKDTQKMQFANAEAQKKIEAKAEQNKITKERLEQFKMDSIEKAADENKITIGGSK